MAISISSLPHGKNRFHSALWQFTPHGDNRLFLCLTARIDFIPPYGDSRLTAIIVFFFASWQESISFRLTAIHASRQYRFSYHFTVIIDLYSFGLIVACLPCSSSFERNGFCTIFLRPDCCLLAMFELLQAEWPLHDIHSALQPRPITAIINFFFASRQESISFRLTAIRATRRYQFLLRLTAIIDFFFAPRKVLLITHQGIL